MKKEEIEKILFSSLSSNHHYIPQFLIKGFINEIGNLFVYDKAKDKIITRPQYPKQVFFEKNRNSVEITDGKMSSIIEDSFYKKIDDEIAPYIKYLQEGNLKELDFSLEVMSMMTLFILTLFWRIPATDDIVSDLFRRSEIDSNGVDPERFRNDPTFLKMERGRLFHHTIDQIRQYGKRTSASVNIHEYASPIILLGDNPIIFRRTPSSFEDLGEIDLLIAVSSNRIFSVTEKKLPGLSFNKAISYNTNVILQSRRYVVASNLDTLEKAIKMFKLCVKLGVRAFRPERIFEPEKK